MLSVDDAPVSLRRFVAAPLSVAGRVRLDGDTVPAITPDTTRKATDKRLRTTFDAAIVVERRAKRYTEMLSNLFPSLTCPN